MARPRMLTFLALAAIAAVLAIVTRPGAPAAPPVPASATASSPPAAPEPTPFEKIPVASGMDPLLGRWSVGVDVKTPGTHTIVFRFGREDSWGVLLDERARPVEAEIGTVDGGNLVVTGVAPSGTWNVRLKTRSTILEARLLPVLRRVLLKGRIAFWIGPFPADLLEDPAELVVSAPRDSSEHVPYRVSLP